MVSSMDEVINSNLVELDLKAKNKNEVIEELVDLLDKEKKVYSKKEFVSKVYERESSMSTYCGSEVAIPHAISSTVKVPTVCFGRSKGLFWDNSEELVKFIFLLAIPDQYQDVTQMSIMSNIARCSLDPKIRGIWQKAINAEQILESLKISINNQKNK